MTTDMTQSGDQPLWEVYDVEDTFGPASLGGDNRIKRVYYHVLGTRDSYVDIPYAKFNTKYVSEQIQMHVEQLIDVHDLKGTAY